MKFYMILLCSLVFFASCASQNKQQNEITALSISPELTYEVTMMNRCEIPFWKSDFGRFVLENKSSKETNLNYFFKALDQRPKACSFAQALTSGVTTSHATQAIKNQNRIKQSDLEIKNQLNSIQHMLTKTDLTFSEMLIGLNLFTTFEEKLRYRKSLASAILEIKRDLIANQDTILTKTINHEFLVLQSIVYRMELMDWNTGLGESATKVPTKTELEKYAKYNKYQEILNMEELRKTLLENQKCLSDGSCFLCDVKIQSKSCTEVELSEEELAKKYNNRTFLMILGPKLQNGIVSFKRKIKKLEN